MRRGAIQTSWDSTTTLGSSQVTPSRLRDWIPKSNKHNWGHRGRGWSALAWIGWLTQKGAQIFSQEQWFKAWILGREEGELKIWISSKVLLFSEWPTTQGGRWGSIYTPHLENSHWESFHRTSSVKLFGTRSGAGLVWSTGLVQWGPDKSSETLLQVGRGGSRSQSRLDMSGQPNKYGTTIRQVHWGFLKFTLSSLEVGHRSNKFNHRPDKSGNWI
jgi:hypothetical protein